MSAELPPSGGWPRQYRIARAAIAIVLALSGLWTIRGFIPALVWAVILAIAVWPLYTRAQTRLPPSRHRVALPLLFTSSIGLLFVVPLLIAAIEAESEARNLLEWYGKAQANGLPPPPWLANISFGSWHAAEWWQENLANPPALSDLVKHLDRDTLLRATRQFGEIIARRFVTFAFMLATLFFLFREGPSLVRQFLVASERILGPQGERLGRQMIASIHGTVDGLVLVGLGEGLALGIGYAVTGVPHPTLLGAFTAVAAMIPFGAPVFFMLAALLLLAQGSIVGAVAILVFGFIVVMVADHVIRPVLIGGATRLPFLWVLFSILGGVETWGLLGLFLGPAIMAALIMLWREVSEEKPLPAEAVGHSLPMRRT